MTDMANGMSQSQDTSSSQPVTTASTSAPVTQSHVPTESSERTFRQSEVTDIVKRAKAEQLDSFKRMQTEQPGYLQQKFSDTTSAPSHPQTQSQPYTQPANNFSLNEESIRRMAVEEAQRLRDQWQQDSQQESQKADAQRTVQEFWNKVSTGRDTYQDFDAVVGDIEYPRFPNVVQLLAGYVDNSADILYELGKDRIKMANLESLAERSPRDAVIQAQRLSQSIKDNRDAQKTRLPNQPLSQMRPSNTGTDNGAMSVKDYRRKYRV
jgi:hypothetical protein